MKEQVIEAYLRDQVRCIGGKAYKFVSPGNTGVPDRLVLLPGGCVAFVELKGLGKKSTPKQLLQQQKIRALGFAVYVIDNKPDIDRFIESCKG